MKLSCQENLVDGNTFAEKVANLEKYGFEGIELGGDHLHSETNRSDRRAVLADCAVRPSSICGGFDCEMVHCDPDRRQACIDTIKRFMDFSAEVGAAGPISVPIFNQNLSPTIQRVPDLSPWKSQHELEIELLTEIARDIARHAEGVGVALLLEPLNRYESNALKNVAEAANICRQVGGTGVRVMADLFHMHIEEFNTPDALENIGDVLGHVHLADNTRREPGTGDINFKDAFTVLKRINFTGYMAFECGLTEEPNLSLPRSVNFLRNCIAEA